MVMEWSNRAWLQMIAWCNWDDVQGATKWNRRKRTNANPIRDTNTYSCGPDSTAYHKQTLYSYRRISISITSSYHRIVERVSSSRRTENSIRGMMSTPCVVYTYKLVWYEYNIIHTPTRGEGKEPRKSMRKNKQTKNATIWLKKYVQKQSEQGSRHSDY